VYRLNVPRLRAITAQHGDKTPYAVAKTTGVSVSSVYRIFGEESQLDLISALRIAEAYDLDIRTLMDRVPDEEEQTAEKVA